MAEIINNMPDPSGAFKEAVCIDGGRVYDSCCDRDCLEDLRCYFTQEGQAKIAAANQVRVKSAEVVHVQIEVEPVSFNRGFYACDITFYFLVSFDILGIGMCCEEVKGISTYSKKVILYGSEGNVRVFSNAETNEDGCDRQLRRTSNMPRCVVQCVDPIALSSKVKSAGECYEARSIPECVCRCIGDSVITEVSPGTPTVYVTLGLFTIVQLIRNVQMLIPVYDFCIPQKQCNDSTDQPCDIFRKIKFPTDDFFPPRSYCVDEDENIGCGCLDE